MYEPTYLVPRPTLFLVQAKADAVRKLSRQLTDAIRDGMPAEQFAELRHEHTHAALACTCAALNALGAGATVDELVGYGISRDLAVELERRAWR
jgi:hypothetical protein